MLPHRREKILKTRRGAPFTEFSNIVRTRADFFMSPAMVSGSLAGSVYQPSCVYFDVRPLTEIFCVAKRPIC
jgi:hypothetical protein